MTANPPFLKNLVAAGRTVFWSFLWLVGLSLILLHPLRWSSGDSLKPVRALSYITAWLLILSLPMLLVAVLRRHKWLSLVLALASVAIILPFAPLFFPRQSATPFPNNLSLKVMTHNLHGISTIDSIIEVIRQQEPDILLIQEYSAALADPSFHGLDDLYPELYVDVTSQGFGQILFSRYPMEQVSAEFDKGRVQKTRIETPAGPIAVWNVHPIPPFLVPPEQFDAQMAALTADIAAETGPLIVAGDFNATDQSAAYRAIRSYLQDAYWEAGRGFGFSYPAPPYSFMDMRVQTGPLWRIDHIFHSQDFIATSIQTLSTSGGSDHFPVVAELSIGR